jgi:hypothetical protein
MKTKPKATRSRKDPVLQALSRAAQSALELARRTGTACYVLEDDEVVDISERPGRIGRARIRRCRHNSQLTPANSTREEE